MSGAEASLALSVFLACAVEAVEAFTIVLAMGTTRGWRAPLAGSGAALVVLAAIVAALGPALTAIPLGVLRVVVGGLLLTFGLQWLRKAILRAAGAKAKHDEEAIFAAEAAAAEAEPGAAGFDGYAFAISLKAVLLEGLEVAFIALTFGANQGRVGLAAAAAGLACLVVLGAGLALRAPLARVPENGMKFAVGVLLTSFGTFLGGRGRGSALARGRGLARPAGRRRRPRRPGPGGDDPRPSSGRRRGGGMSPRRIFLAVADFVVGDDPRLALAAVVAIGLTALLGAWWPAPLIALAALALSLRGARATITQCDTSASDLPTPDSSSSPASSRAPSTGTR